MSLWLAQCVQDSGASEEHGCHNRWKCVATHYKDWTRLIILNGYPGDYLSKQLKVPGRKGNWKIKI